MNIDAELMAGQAGRCAGCGRRFRITESPHLDHDHHSFLIRGWLCGPCNTAEGNDVMRDWAEYRRNPPARRLGLAVVWRGPTLPSAADAWAQHDRARARAMLGVHGAAGVADVAELTGLPVEVVRTLIDPERERRRRQAAAAIENVSGKRAG